MSAARPCVRRIRLVIPKMKRIWVASARSKQGRDRTLERALMMETELLKGVEKGDFTLRRPGGQISCQTMTLESFLRRHQTKICFVELSNIGQEER
jgi:hypothetical protein